jgi:hypothetical protein
MTGNVVLLGFALGGASGFSVPALAVSTGGFVAGALGGGRLGRHLPAPARRGRPVDDGAHADRGGAVVAMLAGAALVAALVRRHLALPLALVAVAEAALAIAYLAVARGAGGAPAW